MSTHSLEYRMSWIFRVALAMCFIGHGAFGIITKQEWVPFFGLVGIARDTAFTLMPLIGTLDIALGVLVLLRPIRAAVLYMALWAVWTAALRPLTGDSIFEMLERAGNYGVPLAFLFLLGFFRNPRSWFSRAEPSALAPEREAAIGRVLSWTTALLLVGHGGLALAQKAVLVRHADVLGLGPESVMLAGAVEIVLALVVLFAPRPSLLVAVALWKVGTEILWPLAGAPVWEFIERGGSYAAPLLLAILYARRIAAATAVAPLTAGLRPAALIVVVSLALAPAPLHAQSQYGSVPVAPAGILDSLRHGGYVIACRHAATHHDQSDKGGTYSARELQRNLSPEGEEQAKNIGAVIRKLGIPIGEVRSNPMYRNFETAQYAFGKAVRDSVLTSGRGLQRFLVAPVPRGTNRAVVVRQGSIYDAFKEYGVKDTEEGDCFIAQPVDSTSFRALARLRAQDWGILSSR
jgi:hypothetical protein